MIHDDSIFVPKARFFSFWGQWLFLSQVHKLFDGFNRCHGKVSWRGSCFQRYINCDVTFSAVDHRVCLGGRVPFFSSCEAESVSAYPHIPVKHFLDKNWWSRLLSCGSRVWAYPVSFCPWCGHCVLHGFGLGVGRASPHCVSVRLFMCLFRMHLCWLCIGSSNRSGRRWQLCGVSVCQCVICSLCFSSCVSSCIALWFFWCVFMGLFFRAVAVLFGQGNRHKTICGSAHVSYVFFPVWGPCLYYIV